MFCYHYDPQPRATRLFATNIMRGGGLLTLLIVGGTLLRLLRGETEEFDGRKSGTGEMNWLRTWLLGPEGSAYARQVDDLYVFLVFLSIFFFLLVAGLAIGSVIVWRKKDGRRRRTLSIIWGWS